MSKIIVNIKRLDVLVDQPATPQRAGTPFSQVALQSALLGSLFQDLQQPGKRTSRPFKVPRLGQHWDEQGGAYLGVMRGEAGKPDYHLIGADSDDGYRESITWGPLDLDITGATSDYDGLANTLALYDSGEDHPAADWAHGLELNGHNDWYLGARREVRLAWVNAPELFKPGAYWTSTQSSRTTAWFQGFGGGNQGDGDKFHELQVRAFRRLLID